MIALKIGENNEVLSACKALKTTPIGLPRVESLPEGDITDYDYINGAFVINENRKAARVISETAIEESENAPTRLDQIEANLYYVAMMEEIEL